MSAIASKTRKLTSAAALLLTFVYSELERKGEVIEVLFDGRAEVVDVAADGRQRRRLFDEPIRQRVGQRRHGKLLLVAEDRANQQQNVQDAQ